MMITLIHITVKDRSFRRLVLLSLLFAVVSYAAAQDIIHPTTGTVSVSVAQGDTRNYYDSGGAGCNIPGGGRHSSGESGVTVFCPSDPGLQLTLEFLEVDIETRSGGNGCFDVLSIYNGDSPSAPLLFQGCGEEGFSTCPGGDPGDGDDCGGFEGSACDLDGTNAPNPNNNIFTSTAPDGCITVRFTSDGSVQEGGWVATVSAAPRPLALTCPPNQTVITDLQSCTFTAGAALDAIFSGPAGASLTNDYNNSPSLVGEVFTSGQTATVTFTATDGADPANDLMCTVVITVEEPFFSCPRDTILTLDQNNLATLPNPFVIPSREVRDTLFSNGQADGSGMIQTYTLPAGITDITLEAAGGNGGAGGSGARLTADFTLSNPNLVILVAAAGTSSSFGSGSGGGGTFIASGSGDFSGVANEDVLLIAGGGSGSTEGGFSTDFFGQDSDVLSSSPDGSAGFGGGSDGGGGASLRNQRSTSSGGGFAIVNGGAGGSGSIFGGAAGGYGGGGQENNGGGGGGGGASGGDGGTSGQDEGARGAEAGTSYSAGANTSAITPNPRADGDGFVVISYTMPGETLTLSQSTFTCADVGQPIQVRATRVGANCTASCTFLVTVNDPSGACSAVSGNIVWEHNRIVNPVGVENAAVTLSGNTTNTGMTDTNGDYSVPGNGDLTVIPTKTNGFYDGVTAADVTRIQQHVTFANRFDDGYKVIAADVNRSNSVTSLDASVIFHSLNGNPNAQNIFQMAAWRFVEATHTFDDENAPWLPAAFPELINLMNVTTNITNQNFIGVKMGDVNGSWGVAVPLNRPALELRTDDQVLVAGQRIRVPFYTNALADVAAWQFALRFDTDYLQLVEAIPTTAFPLDKENFGTWQADRGEVRSVFAVPQGQGLPKGAVIFALDFQVKQSGLRLSEVLRLAEEVLPGAVYDTQLRGGEVLLSFASSGSLPSVGMQDEAALGFVLEQNIPNPVGNETLIRFELPQAGETNFLVHDLQGRLLYEEDNYLEAGQHSIRLDAARLGTTGVVTYTLRSGLYSATRRMVLVR